ncbi:MAG TPA: MFS transporter [Cyclobacteriaceae bacterium]|jgi:MFS family permease|nr:MFS transporter [Cyclobacteriaceae bacterium]
MEASINKIKQAEIDAEKISAYHWLMFFICFIGNVMGGTASTLMSVYLPDVMKDFIGQVSDERFTYVSAYINALYFVGWAIGGLLWGVLGDRIGRVRSLSLTICMFGLFTLLIGFATSWEMIMAFRFFCGFGVGGMLVINTTLLSEAWPEKSRAIFIGILSIGFPVGIFSSGAVNFFVSDWQQGFMIGLLPLCIGFISMSALHESEKWKASESDRQAIRKNIWQYRNSIINGSIIFGSMLIGLWAIFSWVPTWVQSLLTDSDGQHERGLSMMLLGIGGLSGGFCSGWVSNALGTRKAMLLCFSGCFILATLLFIGNTTFTYITLIETGALAFMFGISQGLLSVYIPLLFPVSIRATATGFCFNVGRFFTAAAVFFVGTLVTFFHGYGNSLFAFSSVFLIGFLILRFSKKIVNDGTH